MAQDFQNHQNAALHIQHTGPLKDISLPGIGMLGHGSCRKNRIRMAKQKDLSGTGSDPALEQVAAGPFVGGHLRTCGQKFFLKLDTLLIVGLGVVAFMLSTAGGMAGGVVMYWITGGKVNPLIGSAGVSAVPMAARVSNKEGQKYNPSNFLLMHAMGPNVAGVIGSAIAAGFLLSIFG